MYNCTPQTELLLTVMYRTSSVRPCCSSLSSTWMCAGYFCMGTAGFDCCVGIAPHTKTSLFCGPKGIALGGVRGLEVKTCVRCFLLPHKTYLNTLTRLLKHPDIFSELIKEQSNGKCHLFWFFIQTNREPLWPSSRMHSKRTHVRPVHFPSVFLRSGLWVKAATIKRALQERLTGNTLWRHMNASLCAKCRLCLDCNDKTEQLVWKEMNVENQWWVVITWWSALLWNMLLVYLLQCNYIVITCL